MAVIRLGQEALGLLLPTPLQHLLMLVGAVLLPSQQVMVPQVDMVDMDLQHLQDQ